MNLSIQNRHSCRACPLYRCFAAPGFLAPNEAFLCAERPLRIGALFIPWSLVLGDWSLPLRALSHFVPHIPGFLSANRTAELVGFPARNPLISRVFRLHIKDDDAFRGRLSRGRCTALYRLSQEIREQPIPQGESPVSGANSGRCWKRPSRTRDTL